MRFVILCLAWLLPTLALGAEGDRTFKLWQASCDEANYCTATSGPNQASDAPAYKLTVSRHAERSFWEIALDTTTAPGDDWSEFVVGVDADTATFYSRHEVGAYGAPGRFFFFGETAQPLLDRMVAGTTITVDFNDRSGTARTARFDLAGLSAALLYIDEAQNRLGSERVAFDPPYGLTPAGNEQVATVAVPPILLDRHAADPECEALQDLANGRDIATADLGNGQTLYVLPCWAGAYNFGSKLYVGQDNGAGDEFTLQVFAEFSDTLGWSGATTLVNAFYDEADKSLQTFNKGRGIGDCGNSGRWQWMDSAFRMLEFRYKGACDGQGEPGDFPVIFSARPQPTPAQQPGNGKLGPRFKTATR